MKLYYSCSFLFISFLKLKMQLSISLQKGLSHLYHKACKQTDDTASNFKLNVIYLQWSFLQGRLYA